MKIFYSLAASGLLCSFSSCILAAGDLNVSGAITTSALPSAPAYNNPVCHDNNGTLGNCAGTRPAKVARVAVSGGDYQSPVDAITNLSNWCGTPSATNRCLIKVYPGVYDLGTTPLNLQYDYLDLSGSGRNVTLLKGQMGNYTPLISITGNAHIRDLSIENTNTGGQSLTAKVENANPVFSRVRLHSDSGSENISVALLAMNGSHPTLEDSSLYAKGRAGTTSASIWNASIDIYNSMVEAWDPTGTGSGNHDAIYLKNSNMNAYYSTFISSVTGISAEEDTTEQSYHITAEHSSVLAPGAYAFHGQSDEESALFVAFADSKLVGTVGSRAQPPMGIPEYPRCVGAYDANFYALDTTCQ